MIGFDENGIYVAQLENTWNFYRYDRKQDQWMSIPCRFAEDDILLETEARNGILLISKAKLEQDHFAFEIVSVDSAGESGLLYKNNMSTLPLLAFLAEGVAVSYEKSEGDALCDCLDFMEYKTGKITNLYSDWYTKNKDNRVNGTITVAIGGTGKQLFVEKVRLDQEYLESDKSGITEVYTYDLKTGKEEFFKQLDTKAVFISGMGDCILTSDYAYDVPLKKTGRIIKEKSGSFQEYEIPGIETAKDILNACRLDKDHLVFYNLDSIYIYDVNSMDHKIFSYSSEWEQKIYCSEIKAYENSCGYLIRNEKDRSLIFSRIGTNDRFR